MTDEQLFADVPHPAESATEPPPSDDFEPEQAGPSRSRGPSPFVHGLNPDQFDAVVHDDGPLLVVAGAGSGKTRVLTHRIAHLIHEGVHPSKILAITFTNKAASEMRERVHELVGPVVKTMWVSTFHSACVRILRANGEAIGYPRQFSIYDSADSNRLVSYVIRDLGLDSKRFTPRGVQGIISLKKNELVTPEAMADQAENIFDRKHAEVYAEYQARLLQGRGDGLRRPPDQRRQAVSRARQRPRALPRTVQSHPRRRVPGHEPGAERNRAHARGRPPGRHRRG